MKQLDSKPVALIEPKKSGLPYLSQVLENLPGSIYWKDRAGVYLGHNQFAAQKMQSIGRVDTILGKTDYELFPREIADQYRASDQWVMQTGQTHTYEEIVSSTEGEILIQLSSKQPLYDAQGNMVGVIGNTVDITELKTTQEALKEQIKQTEQAHQSKLLFLSTLSHEIRSPVGNIILLLGLLEEAFSQLKTTSSGMQKHPLIQNFLEIEKIIQEAHQESRRALKSLVNLTDFYQLQSMKEIEPLWRTTQIKTFIQEIINKIISEQGNKIEIQLHMAPSVPEFLCIDYEHVKEAIGIVLHNAVRFSHDQSVKITISLDNSELSPFLHVVIQDQGVGLSTLQLDQLEKVFQTHWESQEALRYQKPAIQLPKAKLLLEASGSTLSLHSVEHKGTQVSLRISEKTLISSDIRPTRILLVEDDKLTQTLTVQSLKALHYHVDWASTGEQAIQMASTQHYHVVLLDISLPDMQGMQVLNAIQEKEPNEIVFICLTSHASAQDEEIFISQGAMAVLGKPVDANQLKSHIEAAVKVYNRLNDKEDLN